jgi:hypothetical protein
MGTWAIVAESAKKCKAATTDHTMALHRTRRGCGADELRSWSDRTPDEFIGPLAPHAYQQQCIRRGAQ